MFTAWYEVGLQIKQSALRLTGLIFHILPYQCNYFIPESNILISSFRR